MKVLIIGRGGREHAIAWKVAQSPLVEKVFVAPGNAGIAQDYVCVPMEETDTDALIDFAKKEQITLTIVGPEAALVNGVTDAFQAAGLTIFGPTKAAARIESSKSFAKELMKKYHIPTADFALFSDYDSAKQYINKKGVPIVIKYNGLAAGKGVIIAQTIEEATNALKEMLVDRKFGTSDVVIEDFLSGPEFSLMTLVNGEEVVALPIAQDHKRAYDGDKGPNTGGMGAYSPVSVISQAVIDEAMETIMKPTAKAMMQEGAPVCGVLYGGLMLTQEGPKVIEFNARFGDPETEVVLPKISSDLVQHVLDILALNPTEIICHSDIFLGVVLASKGYPGSFEKRVPIFGLETVENIVFHCGTTFEDNQWVNTGGRVLLVVGRGENAQAAKQNAYQGVEKIKSDNLFYRKDIGYQLLEQ
ncbi:MAG: phosphoribosylamine--glycine ligase [Bacteroidales bacterium]|jgi:phosphoribosylamine--glycine ligase|nr:phosphoribosylamine--glycine ligase [Bacteroidales bacterium]